MKKYFLLSMVGMQVPSIFSYLPVFTSFLRITFVALQKPCHGNFGKFQGSSEGRFGDSEKDCYFLKIPKWQHYLFDKPVNPDFAQPKVRVIFLKDVA